MLWQPAYMHKLNFDRNNFLLEIIKIKDQAQTLMNIHLYVLLFKGWNVYKGLYVWNLACNFQQQLKGRGWVRYSVMAKGRNFYFWVLIPMDVFDLNTQKLLQKTKNVCDKYFSNNLFYEWGYSGSYFETLRVHSFGIRSLRSW